MVLSITALDEHRQIRKFSCQLNKLEDELDFVNSVVAQGHTPINVFLIAHYGITELPVGAFDGIAVSVAINQLETEWQSILTAVPPTRSSAHQVRIQWIQQWIDHYEARIVRLELAITHVEKLHQQVINLNRDQQKCRRRSEKDPLHPYESTIKQYEYQCRRAYTIRHRLLDRLEELVIH